MDLEIRFSSTVVCWGFNSWAQFRVFYGFCSTGEIPFNGSEQRGKHAMKTGMSRVGLVSISAVSLFLGISNIAHAASANSPCVQNYGKDGAFDYQMTELPDGSCALDLSPNNYLNFTYRSFIVDNEGAFMVF